jgi:hypothetical protein
MPRNRPCCLDWKGTLSTSHYLLIDQSCYRHVRLDGYELGLHQSAHRYVLYVQVIDISGLSQVHEDQWTAIVVLHTWQFGRPPPVVPAFVDHTRDRRKLIVLTTSGSGHARLSGVDAISSASVDRDVPTGVMEIIPKLDGLLGSSN